jgi:hypothetical protein
MSSHLEMRNVTALNLVHDEDEADLTFSSVLF